MVADWGHILPPLKGLATYPVWHGGELLFGEGYHEQTRLWLASYDVTIESFGSPQEAASYLREEWLVDFPFASERDFATALMLLASIIMARTTLAE
jgi:hypothetical protein